MTTIIAIPLRSATADSKTPFDYARTSTPKAARSHRYSAAQKRQTDRSRTRRTEEVLYPTQSPCNINAAITVRFPASRGKPACLDTHAHMATKRDNHHVAIPLRSATTDSKTSITTHAQAHPKQLEATVTWRQKKGKLTVAATATHRRYLSSPAATSLLGKTHGFVLRLPPQHKPHATLMQPSQCVLQHSLHHHFP